MWHILQHLVKRFSQKKQEKQIVGTLVIKWLQDYFQREDVEGYVRHHIVFVRTHDQTLKIELFRKQREILQYLQAYLQRLGYSYILKKILLK